MLPENPHLYIAKTISYYNIIIYFETTSRPKILNGNYPSVATLSLDYIFDFVYFCLEFQFWTSWFAVLFGFTFYSRSRLVWFHFWLLVFTVPWNRK